MHKDTNAGVKGKIVVITGASSGVGRATALEFARQGATVVLGARREDALKEVAAECEALGGKAKVVVTDVTDPKAVHGLAAAAMELGGRIDVWINNAGVLAAGEFTQTPIDAHDQVIRTNLMGYLHGAHAVLPHFKRQGYGVLINNISVGGWFPVPYGVGYSASKFGLRGFSEALKGELRRYPDIHVCDLYPAFLDTPGIQHAGNYTSGALKPAPPVYDPRKVARRMVAVARNPRSVSLVGFTAPLLWAANAFFPGLTRGITARVIEGYLKQAKPIAPTSGNLFAPVEYGNSIDGGWRLPPARRIPTKTKLLLLAGIAAGWLLLGRREFLK